MPLTTKDSAAYLLFYILGMEEGLKYKLDMGTINADDFWPTWHDRAKWLRAVETLEMNGLLKDTAPVRTERRTPGTIEKCILCGHSNSWQLCTKNGCPIRAAAAADREVG